MLGSKMLWRSLISLRFQVSSLRPYGHIVDDIKRDLISFGPYNWSFVRRSGNEVPHCLAKHAKFVSNFVSWMEESPEFFLPPLQFESY